MRKHIQILLGIILAVSVDVAAQTIIDCNNPAYANSPYCKSLGEFNCSDGIDNDGDGFFDYYDADCSGDPDNPNDYIVANPECQKQPVGNEFDIEVAWDANSEWTSAVYGMPAVGDIDNDGMPEVITANEKSKTIYILNGADGTIENKRTVSSEEVFSYPTIADVDGDGYAEIFIFDNKGNLYAYEHDLTPITAWGGSKISVLAEGRMIGIADFNQDGTPELYYGNEIRDAQTGELIIKGTHGNGTGRDWDNHIAGVGVAVDILPDSYCADCQGLELVLGNIIYAVDITGKKLTEVLNMDNAATKALTNPMSGFTYQSTDKYRPKKAQFGKQNYSSTSVVDFNQDGSLDVIIGGTLNDATTGPTMVFFWDIKNNSVKAYLVTRPYDKIPPHPNSGSTVNLVSNFRDVYGGSCDAGDGSCTWMRGLGSLNIANIDDDPELEVTFMSGSSLYALDQNFNEEWGGPNHENFWETSSGFTGTAIFDFDGDGSSEIIYRDEVDLYIIDGKTGKPLNGLLTGTFCSSNTQAEYPIVADVNGDGETEIIVSCSRDQNTWGQPTKTANIDSKPYGFIRAYKAASDSYWVPSRSVWNQPAYFNVNINDNLSVPKVQQPHHKPLSLSLNKFLNQSPRINYSGQLIFPAPKLDFVSDSVQIFPPVCPDNQFKVRLYFENNGDAAVNISIPVSFYADDPQKAHGNGDPDPYLETIDLSIAGGLQIGQKIDTTITVNGKRGDFTLYVSLNDIGPFDEDGVKINNADFYPLNSLNGPVRECDDTPTIVSKGVNPYPFDVLAKVISDNRKCLESAPNNGEAQVYAADGSVLPETDYDFVWTDLSTGKPISYSSYVDALGEGAYEVKVSYNNQYTCQGKADTVEVKLLEIWPVEEKITIDTLQMVSNCKPGTADGKAQVLINDTLANDADYEIVWIDEQEKDTVAVGAIAEGLKALLYDVIVTNKFTGCSEQSNIDMTLDVSVIMKEPTTSAVSNCKNPNGSINAQLISGSKSSYEYMLIQHSPKQDTTISNNNGSFPGLNVGLYELRAYDPKTECGKYTEGFFVEVKPSKDPVLTVEVVQEQTACEPPYNGQLSATIGNGKMEDYNFVWYRGYEDPANIVATTATTPDTLSTNITDTYIVIATNTQTNCNAFGQIQLPDNVQPPPTITYNIINHQTACIPDGSVQVTASPIGTDYKYYLLQGSDTVATNNTGTFTGLEAGPYVTGVVNEYTNCVSELSSIFYIEDLILPLETVTFNKMPRTNCDPATPNGALEAVISDGDVSNYSFTWYEGVDTSTPVDPQPDPDASHYLTNIDAGDYVVRVTNNLSKCDTLIFTDLTDESVNYRDSIAAEVIVHQYYCHDDKKSGVIEATLIQSVSGPVPDPDNYTFYWYKGRKTDLENGTAILISGENSSTLSGQDAGWYTVRAERNEDDEFGCSTLNAAEVKIEDMRDYPVANINIEVVEQTSCESNNPNGGLKGNVDGNITDYIFTWYQVIGGVDTDITVNNPDAVINGFEVSNIGEGTYVLEVEHIETGCTGREQVFLSDNIIKGNEIKLILSSTEAANCNNPDGIAEVTEVQISEDGGNTFTKTDTVSNYNYQWYEGNDTSTPIDPAVNPTAITSKLENAAPGDYTVIATGKNTACPSIPYTTTVESSLQTALTFNFGYNEQTDCIDPDGGLWVENISGGSGGYSYQWYKGSTLNYPISGETNNTISNIRSDKYTIVITDNATGCSAQDTYTLQSDLTPVPPATLSSMTHSTTCDPAAYNGELVAEVDPGVRAASYPGHADSDFFYYWFEGENAQYTDPNGNLDDPNNYAVFRNDPPVAGANKSTISKLAPGLYTVIIVDAKDYIASGGTASFGCQSDPRTFEVEAIAQSPAVVFTTQLDTMCIGASGSATITAGKRTGDTTPYSGHEIVSATKDGDPLALSDLNINKNTDGSTKQTTFTLTELEGGEYEFEIKDTETTCDTLIRINIDSREESPNLQYTDVQVNQYQTTCNPDNGEVAVVNPPSSKGQLSDYEFYWHNEFPSDPINDADFTGTVWSGLDSGWYYVFAQDKVTGCISSYQAVEVKYQVTETVVKKTTVEQNANCDATTPNGEITVEAHEEDNNGMVSTPAGGYTFTWYKDGAFYAGPFVDPAKSTISGLEAGTYRVEVENNDLQCVVKEAIETIKFEPVLPKFTAASTTVQHVKTCNNDGSITIKEIKENGITITESDPAFTNYTFEWYQGDLNTQLPVTTNTISNLPADTYYVYIINTLTGGCKSDDLEIILEDNSENPLIYKKEIVDFITCTNINEGAIEVSAGEKYADIPASNYTFTWEYADGSALPGTEVISSTSTGSRISNLEAGNYRVIVLNNDTQCSDTAYYTVKTKVYYPILVINKIQDQTYCESNGWAEVTGVTFRGNLEDMNDYTFEWYEGSLSNPISSDTYGLSADGRSANQLVAGTYLVKAISQTRGCETFPIQITIEDKTEPLVVIPDGIIEPILGCDPATKAKGEIAIKVNNSQDFITHWYKGSSISQMADSIPGLGNLLEINNLTPGYYTIYVEDTITGCNAIRTYEIEGIEVPLTVFLSTTPYSSCIVPNGKVAANVNGGTGPFQFTWYNGKDTNTSPILITESTILDNLTDGLYTVMVQDLTESACQAINAEVVVRDGRGKEIQITVKQDFPVTNCNENNPNGQLTASVDGDVSRYNFFWYEGRDTSKRPIAKGTTASNLAPKEYTVIARDKVTGCLSGEFYQKVQSKQEEDNFPTPEVSVLSHVTHCTKPNGSAIAVLDSTLIDPNADYEYIWTDEKGKVIFSSTRTNIVNGLMTGNYYVTIYNAMTQCYVSTGEVSIIEDIYVPDFEIVTTPSTCLDATGTISLQFTEPIQIVDIEWITPIGYASGFYLINQPAGDYQVKIRDANGCVITKTAKISSNIYTFNGVSPNGDNKNDKFIISCIENFERRTVRIYNRAGALVFENQNYDNEISYFEGYGNRGVYIGGDKLPDGTYFYIIDKHDGEKPVSGYLELLR